MAKVVVMAQTKDLAKWEAGFRSHAEFFKSNYGISKTINYGTTDGNYCAVCFEPDDVALFMKNMKSPETQAAMASDGLIPETVKVFALGKDLKV